MTEPPGDPGSDAGGTHWREWASFVVYVERRVADSPANAGAAHAFRCSVHHMESGEHSAWRGLAFDEAGQWMVRRIRQRTAPATRERHGVPSDAAIGYVADGNMRPGAPSTTGRWDISSIRLLQPGVSSRVQIVCDGTRTWPGWLHGNHAFEVHVLLGHTQPPQVGMPESDFHATVSAQDIESWQVTELWSAGLRAFRLGETHRIRLVMPDSLAPGRYRLRVTIAPLPRAGADLVRELPMVQVD